MVKNIEDVQDIELDEEEQAILVENELNSNNVTKYQTAADIVNRALVTVMAACVEGAKVVDVCALGDRTITEACKTVYNKGSISKGKEDVRVSLMIGLAFPTCVSPNGYMCHFSPMKDDPEGALTLKKGDTVRIEMGCHIDGYISQVAHTLVVGSDASSPVTGRQADVMQAAHYACEAVLRTLKPGNTNEDVTEIIQQVAKEFDCLPIEGMLSHQLQRNTLDGPKQIILNPSEEQRKDIKPFTFEEGEAYSINLLISTGEGKSRLKQTRTTVFSRNPNASYLLKMKTSRAVFSEINQKFGNMAFTLESLEEPKKARLGIIECRDHQLVVPYDVLEEKSESAIVAHVMFTVLLLPQGPLKITTGPALDAQVVKSEKTIQSEAIQELLKTSVRAKKANKKKKKAQA